MGKNAQREPCPHPGVLRRGRRQLFRAGAYLKAFHVQSVLDYGAYRRYPEFQRFVDARANGLRARGIEVDLMK